MVFLLLAPVAHAHAPIIAQEAPKPQGIVARVIQCESGGKVNAIGDHGLAYGIAQFHEDTFNRMKRLSGYYWLDYRNPNDQILLIEWAFAHGHEREWSCYTKLVPE